MSISKRLTEVYESAKVIPFDDSSKLIIFCDCHRGDNSWADDFAHNQNLFFHALGYYYEQGFTYIQLGDGDDLLENKDFEDIRRAHSHVFWLMRKFHQEKRLHLIWGNHDIEWKERRRVEERLHQYYDERTQEKKPLFDGIKVYEGLVLKHADTNGGIFLVHGHQGALFSDRLWKLSRFFVRHLWRHLQLLGLHDPTSPAQNFKKRAAVEEQIVDWVSINEQVLIAGHTHRPRFPDEGKPPYFNAGSCVHPRSITGIEMQDGEIALIKWWVRVNDDGVLQATREVLAGPRQIGSLF